MNFELKSRWVLLIALLAPSLVVAEESLCGEPASQVQQDSAQQNSTKSNPRPNPGTPVPASVTAPVRAPLTVGEKFHYAVRHGFGPTAAGTALLTGAWQQWRNDNRGYGQGAEGYFSRVGSRYGRTATNHMLGSFFLASVFRQDPRHGRSASPSKRARLFYALSRVLITRGDNGRTQFNISGVGGTMGAAFMSSTWHLPPDNTMERALKRGGISLGAEGLRNILREFWPDIRRKLRLD